MVGAAETAVGTGNRTDHAGATLLVWRGTAPATAVEAAVTAASAALAAELTRAAAAAAVVAAVVSAAVPAAATASPAALAADSMRSRAVGSDPFGGFLALAPRLRGRHGG